MMNGEYSALKTVFTTPFPLACRIRVIGFTTPQHPKGTTTANAKLTPSGLTTVLHEKLPPEEVPRLEITCTITNPITSSIIAALASTTPNLVFANPLVLKIVKVVPRLVAQSAAPAAKH